jgi:hypothetical protein
LRGNDLRQTLPRIAGAFNYLYGISQLRILFEFRVESLELRVRKKV